MPGKLPGGKVRISQSAPSIIKKTKNPATSEVQYFGLVRDLYLEDLTSGKDALEQVLEDIQDPAERKAEGTMKVGDLAIIDGIVDSNVKKEDLLVLAGASLTDAEGGTLVNPRYRISDRIAQFATFAGRGIEFAGAGPVKYTYLTPIVGDLLPGTVQITTAGVVTGSGTTFDSESGIAEAERLNRTLEPGDYVSLYEEDGITLHKTGGTTEIKKADEAIYKVTAVTSNTAITLSPSPGSVVTAGKKLRKRYCHNTPPPFFKEAIDSTAFNAPDSYPTTSNYKESHRLGFIIGGVFQPEKGFEEWWEGKYNHEMRSASEYGNITDNSETNPKYPIVKDGNLSFEVSREALPQKKNIGFRFDAWMRKGVATGHTFAKFKAQVNGHLKIDYFDQTGYSGDNATGTWRNALDTTDSDTFFRQINKESPANNRLLRQEIFIQGGPDFRSNTQVAAQSPNNSLDLSETYNDEEGNSKNRFINNYVPVVFRYWFGQDTIDKSSSPIPEIDQAVSSFDPSFAVSLDSINLPAANLEHYNSYFGFLKLTWVDADSRWTIASSGLPANYDSDSSKFAHQFEVVAYSETEPTPSLPAEANRNVTTLLAAGIAFGNITDDPLIADRYNDGSIITTNQLSFSLPGITPSDGDELYILAQQRPNNIVPTDTATRASYTRDSSSIFAASLFNPDPTGNYQGIADMLAGGTNFIEPDPRRNEFEDNAEYFKYKFGNKPGLNTYGQDRYDGFIKNRVSTSTGTYDSDYAHTTILPIGRQQKGVSSTEATTGNNVPNPKALSTDVTPNETREAGENYTFISVEEDEAGNGGEVALMGYPINTLAAILGGAGQGDGGRVLHAADNNSTFNNTNRQGIDVIHNSLQNLPTAAQFDDDATLTAGSYSLKYASLNSGGLLILYPVVYTGAAATSPGYNATTRGMISSLSLGITAVAGAGTNGRSKSNKSVFFTGFEKNTYSGSSRTTEDNRYFIDFLLGTRPNSEKEITITTLGEIEDSDIFSNLGGSLSDTSGKQVYEGALIEFYANSDALGNSGEQTATATPPVAQAYVTGYVSADQKVTYSITSGTAPATGNHSVRVYYNYFEVTKVPAKNTNAVGTIGSTSLSATADTSTMQMQFVYNSSYGLSRTDTGSGLSFAESLYAAENASATSPQVNPFNSQTELPSPPSVTVTPFDFDNQPTNPSDPGFGGLCYPPYQTQDVDLKLSKINDALLYNLTNNAEGRHDVYFGSPQVSLNNLGNKFLQVTQEFAFDFSEADRPRIIPAASGYTLPTFSGSSYTHKLKVNLNPYIGNPADDTGLFTDRGIGDYKSIPNDNIFKDVLLHSNNKPVKETFYLFAKKVGDGGETPISILTDNNPGYS